MLVQIATHWFKPDRREAGIQGLQDTGRIQLASGGCISRTLAVSAYDRLCVVSVTTWRSQTDVDAFRSAPERLALHGTLGANYARPTRQEWFEVLDGSPAEKF